VSYCSSVGPTIFAPLGLIAELFCHIPKSSLRGIIEESKPARLATHIIIEDGKLDDVDDDMDDPDL
jgi:hypothetical protein